MSPAKGNSLQRGAGGGGQEAHSYFLDRPGNVDLKNGLKWKNVFTLFQLGVLMKITVNQLNLTGGMPVAGPPIPGIPTGSDPPGGPLLSRSRTCPPGRPGVAIGP